MYVRYTHTFTLKTTWAFVEWNQRWLDSLELTSAAASSQCSFILLFRFLLFILSFLFLILFLPFFFSLSLFF